MAPYSDTFHDTTHVSSARPTVNYRFLTAKRPSPTTGEGLGRSWHRLSGVVRSRNGSSSKSLTGQHTAID